jgi:hypothetical protein
LIRVADVLSPAVVYERRRPEATTLYQVVADNLATLYGAVDDGALGIALPRFVKKELEGYLDCGLLCRGFARLRCDGCEETRLVAFSCSRWSEPTSVSHYLRALGEPTGAPARAPARGPPFWKSRVLRRAVLGDEAAE